MRKKLMILIEWLKATIFISCCITFGYVVSYTIQEIEIPMDLLIQDYLKASFCVIPICLSFLAIQYSKKIWEYIIFVLVIVGATYFLTLSFIMTILAFVICFNRLIGRLQQENVWFDDMSSTYVYILAGLYVMGIVMKSGGFRQIGFFTVVIYLLFNFITQYLYNLDLFIDQNSQTANFPTKRIQHTNQLMITSFFTIFILTIATIILFSKFIGEYENNILEMLTNPFRNIKFKVSETSIDAPKTVTGSDGEEDIFAYLNANAKEPPVWLSLFYSMITYITWLGIIALIIFAIYKISRMFKSSYSKENDIIEKITPPQDKYYKKFIRKRITRNQSKNLAINHKVRKAYIKIIRKNLKELPDRWSTPTEIETAAQIMNTKESQHLHRIYEKARYSQKECQGEEYDKITNDFKG